MLFNMMKKLLAILDVSTMNFNEQLLNNDIKNCHANEKINFPLPKYSINMVVNGR